VLELVFALADPPKLLGLSEYPGFANSRHPRFLGLTRAGPGLFRAWAAYGQEVARLMFEEIDGRIHVIDAEQGTLLAEIDGVDMGIIERWADSIDRGSKGFLRETRLGVVEADRLETVELPGVGADGVPVLFASDKGFFAYRSQPDSTVRTWRSGDGRDWVESELLGDDPDEPTEIESIDAWRGRVTSLRLV
jgi:hypothetical protein